VISHRRVKSGLLIEGVTTSAEAMVERRIERRPSLGSPSSVSRVLGTRRLSGTLTSLGGYDRSDRLSMEGITTNAYGNEPSGK
jgi:hypothetical protein